EDRQRAPGEARGTSEEKTTRSPWQSLGFSQRNSQKLQSRLRKNPRPLRQCAALVPWKSQDRAYRHGRDGACFTLRGPVFRARFFPGGGCRAIPIARACTGG